MPEAHETHDTPRCPTCGELMIAPEGTFLCMTALAESYQDESGAWLRMEKSSHPVLDEEVAYLKKHGVFRQFI
jgi:hypothetical protein